MSRIKYIQEELRSIDEKMNAQISSIETEKRPRSEEEVRAWGDFKTSKNSYKEELRDLLDLENEKKTKALANAEKESQLLGAKDEEQRAVVGQNRAATEEAMLENTEEILRGVVSGDQQAIFKAQKELVDGGHYGEAQKKIIEERDGFSTMKDGKGGIFIPTMIADKIFDMEQEYGIIPKYCENFGISESRKKIPSILSRPSFYAVVEKAAIPGSSLNLGGMMLDPNKWACIVDWTNEIGREAGRKILPILNKKIAEASAFLKDNTVFNGDGTSTYHNKKGLINLSQDSNKSYVGKVSAGSGDTSLGAIDATDLLSLKFSVAPSARSRGVYVCHPDFEEHLMNLQDGAGNYIYGGPANATASPTLWRRPLEFSEAFPVLDGADKPVISFFDPAFLAYGTGRNMSVTKLSEASITDEDGTTVNLATQDSSALRFIESFDFEMSDKTTTTESVEKGAFSVLHTAAS